MALLWGHFQTIFPTYTNHYFVVIIHRHDDNLVDSCPLPITFSALRLELPTELPMGSPWSDIMSPRGHMKPSSTVDFGLFVVFWQHQNVPCLTLIEIVIFGVNYTILFDFSLLSQFLVITFQLFENIRSFVFYFFNFLYYTKNVHVLYVFGLVSLMRIQYPKCAYDPCR